MVNGRDLLGNGGAFKERETNRHRARRILRGRLRGCVVRGCVVDVISVVGSAWLTNHRGSRPPIKHHSMGSVLLSLSPSRLLDYFLLLLLYALNNYRESVKGYLCYLCEISDLSVPYSLCRSLNLFFISCNSSLK